MPTYEYICEACNHKFEKFQPMSQRPIRKCPACGKQKAKRLIGTGAGVIFKGSGFYQTDYRNENYKKAADREKSPAPTETKGPSKDTPAKTPSDTTSKPATSPKKDKSPAE